jgi:hypothetical protein
MKRTFIILAFGILLVACGGAPEYTVRQAVVDMPAYEPYGRYYLPAYDTCVAKFLFRRMSPEQVKGIIRSADFGSSPAVVVAAQRKCQAARLAPRANRATAR